MKRIACVVWAGVLASAACSSSGNNGPAQIVVTSPQSGSVVNLSSTNTTDVSFNVTNFKLQQPGTCGSATDCGQVYADIDNGACNQTNKTYNAIAPGPANGSTGSVTLDFGLCPASSFAGIHTITLSLHLDNGSTVIGAGNAPAVAQISITTTGGSLSPGHDAGP